jgi:hypothetical protein
VQLGFYLETHSAYDVFGRYISSVGAGWYVDDIRLTHDFALLAGSGIVQTQQQFCIPLTSFASVPATSLSFTLSVPAGYLQDIALDIGSRFAAATMTQIDPNTWRIVAQPDAVNPLKGHEALGSICFKAIAPHSAFVPVTLSELRVNNQDGSVPPTDAFSGRAVVIAGEPLLEATHTEKHERLVKLFGQPGTDYQLEYTFDLAEPRAWTPERTNTIPAALYVDIPLTGEFSNAPALFFRATKGN